MPLVAWSQYTGGAGSGYALLQFVAPQAVTTGTVAGPICAGSAVVVPFTAEAGTFNAGNVFTAELSSAGGSFAAPVAIGALSGTSDGSINAVIPAGTPAGTGYRIRVVSSDPVVSGTNNGTDITITAPPLWYPDLDGDGFGAGAPVQDCTQPIGHVANNLDCDDGDLAITAIGQSCDDGDPGTANDVVTVACVCEGVSTAFYRGGDGSGYAHLQFVAPQAITTGTVTGPLCAGSTIAVPFTAAAGFFNTGNVFTAQLSDASGSFTAPVAIGDLSGTTDGSINAVIPGGTPAGGGYRIRVVGSDPVVPGTNNGTDIAITAPPLWYADLDGDGFGAGSPVPDCIQPVDHVSNNLDCDDGDQAITAIGLPCDDGNAGTTNDVITAACTCEGVSSAFYAGGIGSGYALLAFAAPPFITTAPVSGPLCAGSTLDLSFVVEGAFNAGNSFTAELSDAIGSFASPTAIGTSNGTNGGTIAATIPAGTPDGSGYRIRVTGSDPPVVGADNGADISVLHCVQVSVRAMLEGPYNSATGLMNDALRGLPSFPLADPYPGIGYMHVGGGNDDAVAPGVLSTAGNNAIVDWVLLELRDANTPATVVSSRSALVQRDGDVVEPDGVSPVRFPMPAGSYHLAVRHRNHLGCMTAGQIALGPTSTTVDLTTLATPTFGTNARKASGGAVNLQLLWAGDVTFNGQVKYAGGGNDRDPILVRVGGTVPTNTANGYFPEDVNLNGQVKYAGSANDRDPILVNIGGTVPTALRVQQLP
ncbi:MAG: hypothetical protein JNJ64_13405 [Flavobacteriales bacterium]|nr:hypothetical protein [Flavobacteriales bacterium]